VAREGVDQWAGKPAVAAYQNALPATILRKPGDVAGDPLEEAQAMVADAPLVMLAYRGRLLSSAPAGAIGTRALAAGCVVVEDDPRQAV
jgi:hypothetical protein